MNASVVAAAIAVMIAIQGVLLIESDDPAGAIPMAAIVRVVGHRLVAGWLMVVALPVSLIILSSSRRLSAVARFGCLAPQLAISLIFAWGAITGVIWGHYADGVARPQSFILADQLTLIVLMILHSAAVAEIVKQK